MRDCDACNYFYCIHDRIRGQESPDDRIVPAGLVEIQRRAAVPTLPGEAVGGHLVVGVVTRRAKGIVAQFGHAGAAAVQRQRD